MSWASFVVALLVFVACYLLGIWLGTKPRHIVLASIVTCLIFLFVRVFLRYFPSAAYALLNTDTYAAIHTWWAFLFAFSVLGIGTRHMSTRNARFGVALLAVVLLLLIGSRAYASVTFDPSQLSGRPLVDGVCRQTSNYSCGAAAASTLLAQLGINSDEREMAVRCGTNALSGTDEFAVCRGLRSKLAGTGWRVDLVESDWESLRRQKLRIMVTVKFSFLIDHWVVVLKISDDEVVVGDPLIGRVSRSKAGFLSDWRKVVVTVER